MSIDYTMLNKLFASPVERKAWATILTNIPVPYKPEITQSDVRDGFMHRYFVRRVNDINNIVEIDKSQYTAFKKNPLYVVADVRWRIIGRANTLISNGVKNEGVRDINIRTVSNEDLTFGGLTKYIADYTEFWIGETRPLS
jgi:hypothetical protein